MIERYLPPPAPVAVVLHRIVLRLLRPHRTAHGVVTDRPLTLVEWITDDGRSGWGECSSLAAAGYDRETAGASFAHLRDDLVPVVLRGGWPPATSHPFARSAIEVAALDASLGGAGVALRRALGAVATHVPSCAVVSAAGVDELVEAVGRRVDAGQRSVCVKVTPRFLVEPLAAVRREHPGLALSADANGSLAGVDLSFADDLGLDWIEQPVPADRPELLPVARRTCAVPFAVDEGLSRPDDVSRWGEAGATIVNVKPGRLGGLALARAVLERSAEAGLAAFCGGMLECGVGRAAVLALAAHPACTLPAHLGPTSDYFERDVAEAVDLDAEGRLPVPAGPGIGTAPVAEALAALTVERVRLDRQR